MSAEFITHHRNMFLSLVVGFFAIIGSANAQTYPAKVIKVIVPWPAGGAIDFVARSIALKLPERLGQQVIVENRAGANGFIGTVAVARSEPDGYTLLFADVGTLAISPAMRTDTPYDPVKDFVPISLAVSSPFVLVVNPAVPAKSMQELVEYAKSRPGKLTYGSFGTGSIAHLAGAMLQSLVPGLDIVHVPYKGAPPAIADLMGGQIDMVFLTVSSATPLMQSGKVRGLAVTTRQRSPLLPNLPAIAELYPGFEVNSWYGMLASAGTPPDIVARLQKEISVIIATPDMKKELQARGFTAEGTSSGQFAGTIKQDLANWSKVIKSAGLVEAK